MSTPSVAEFFDAINRDYTATIQRCFPRYREMLCALVDYLPRNRVYDSILEIGCGTGNLSVLLAQAFPSAQLHLLDVSPESLQVCRQRLAGRPAVDLQQRDIRTADFEPSTFDLVISSIAIHHLTAEEKRELFQRCYRWLAPSAVFAYADQFRGVTNEIYTRHINGWKALSLAAGSNEQEFGMWMEHQRQHDHHDTLVDQLRWLSEAGFGMSDCVWRSLLWCSVIAFKE